jgi:hypothetical protein
MRRAMLAFWIVAGICLQSIPPADACGDKSLRIGAGIRFRRTMHPAKVLIYVPNSTPDNATTRALCFQPLTAKLRDLLTDKHHTPQTVRSATVLAELLSSGKYDVVLTDLSEAGAVQNQIDNAPSKPLVVAVASSDTSKQARAEVDAAKKQYRYIVTNPNRADQYLDAIEEAMKSRMKILAKKA